MSGIDNEGLHVMPGVAPPKPAPGLAEHHARCGNPYHLAGQCVIRPVDDGIVLPFEFDADAELIVEGDRVIKNRSMGERSRLAFPRGGDIRAAPARDERIVDRVAVGGPLHGLVVGVPAGATHVMTFRASESISVPLPVAGPGERVAGDPYVALSVVVTYLVRNRGNARLLIESETLASGDRAGKSNRLGETIVEALAIASGVHGSGGPLVKMLPPPDFDD